jgi:hypothetical protein
MKRALFLWLAAALLLALGACSDDDDPASLTVTGASGSPVALNGTWGPPGGCLAEPQGGSSEATTTVISGPGLSFGGSTYWNVIDCSGTANFTLSVGGSFTLGNTVSVPLASTTVTAQEIDITYTVASGTPTSAADAAELNADEACGVTNWAAGVASNILGICIMSPEMNLIYVDDTVTPNRMYMGDDSGILTSVERPTALSSEYEERL